MMRWIARRSVVALVLTGSVALLHCDDPSHAPAVPRSPEENPGAAHEQAQWNRLYEERIRRSDRPEVQRPSDVNPVTLGAAGIGVGAAGAAIAVGAGHDGGRPLPQSRDTPSSLP